MQEIPIYLFVGFLSAGKTRFIQETLEDERFNTGEKTLLVVCEEGEEEYHPDTFATQNVTVVTVENEAELTRNFWNKLLAEHQPERILLEYHGMWQLKSLYDSLPGQTVIVQQFCFFEAATATVYNANLRALVVDKLQNADLVAFNRVAVGEDIMPYHKLVRAVSRNAAIVYDRTDGSIQQDDIEDPLPFDVNAPIIEIGDDDYALWYRDMSAELEKYEGKTVRFLAMVALGAPGMLPKNCIVVGRRVMTCCVDDIQYAGLACEYSGALALKNKDWVRVTATVAVKHHKLYGRKGPVLVASEVQMANRPENEVVTF
jgi:hypothetical protein